MDFLARCLHDLTALGPSGLAALMAALFLAGLGGGATHCAGMCAPFVLAQAAAGADRFAGGGQLARLAGAALLPYHLGRMLGYAALGAVAGLSAGALSGIPGLRLVLAGLLAAAAVLMLAQALARGGIRLPTPRLPRAWERRVAGLLAAPSGGRGVLLGLLLSALPCGLLYAALVAAAAAGSALGGALGMLAFAAGTIPGLIAVALLGRLLARRFGAALGRLGAALFAVNALLLGGMALRLLG